MIAESNFDRIRDLRKAFWANGYRPVAIWSPGAQNTKGEPIRGAGKRPVGLDWLAQALADPPAAVTASVSSLQAGTGIVTGAVIGLDVDVLDQGLVDAIVALSERRLGVTPLVRIGRAPKTLMVYRVDEPFAKIVTSELFLPDGTKAQVEVLADGQQFVADGIHPDTGQPYAWTGSSPEEMPASDLPLVHEGQLRDVLVEIEALLREAGAVEKDPPEPPPPPPPPKPPGSGKQVSDFFRQVNSAALTDLSAWVTDLFPRARYQQRTGAYRVSSADLGRGYEEDISLHPDGIRDFGSERPLTPIDLVMEFGAEADPVTAAKWLCDRLGVTPESLGWQPSPKLGNPGPTTGQNSFRDPWDQPPTPEWPGGILPAPFEDMISATAEGSGIDPGAIGMAALVAVSGAAAKNRRFKPYGENHSFVVPPILWAMEVARSGQRKTYLSDVFVAFRQHRDKAWSDYQKELGDWHALDKQAQKETPKPREPFACLVQDITPEKLARMLAENDRGTLVYRDELAPFFGFGRYSNDRGVAERGMYLEAYDGDPYLQQRATHDAIYVRHAAVAIFGSIQPRRLRKLNVDALGEDGLLQRFMIIQPRTTGHSQNPGTNTPTIPGRAPFNKLIGTLLEQGGYFARECHATPDGADILYRLEGLGLALSELDDYAS